MRVRERVEMTEYLSSLLLNRVNNSSISGFWTLTQYKKSSPSEERVLEIEMGFFVSNHLLCFCRRDHVEFILGHLKQSGLKLSI